MKKFPDSFDRRMKGLQTFRPYTRKARNWGMVISIISGFSLLMSIVLYSQVGPGGFHEFLGCKVPLPGPFCKRTRELEHAMAALENARVSLDGFGPVQIGMSLTDAYAALGIAGDSIPVSTKQASANCYISIPLEGALGFQMKAQYGGIVGIVINSPDIRTDRGIGIGSTSESISEVYSPIVNLINSSGKSEQYMMRSKDRSIVFSLLDGVVRSYQVGHAASVGAHDPMSCNS